MVAPDPFISSDPTRRQVERPTYMVESVHSALVLLSAIRDRGAMRVSDAAREIGVADSTAHRLLATLVYHGYVRQGSDRRYGAGPLIGVGPTTSDLNRSLYEVSISELQSLSTVTGETANVVVRTSKLARVIASVESLNLLRAGNRQGHTPPARNAAGGKALLASLADPDLRRLYADEGNIDGLLREMRAIRALGHASAIDEVENGLSSVAVCLHSTKGQALAALVVALPTTRFRAFVDGGNLARIHTSARRIELAIASLGEVTENLDDFTPHGQTI